MSTWADASVVAMTKALLDSRAAGLTQAETAKAIDAAYPFGQRKYHPYKVWLRERKAFFARHGLPRNGDHGRARERAFDLVSQMDLEPRRD